MNVAISGAFLRPGQEGNISWLWATIAPILERLGITPDLVRGNPLSFEGWVHARLDDEVNYATAFAPYDLVIGFELFPSAKRAAKQWVDVRRHPFRWGNPVFSVEASFPFSFDPVFLPPPRLLWDAVQKYPDNQTCFMCQVHSDASMLVGYGFIYPEAMAPKLKELVETHETVWVVDHPAQRGGIWAQALQKLGARPWPGTGYDALAKMRSMWTVTSSTGFEAPFFDCIPHFLGTPHEFSSPFDITSQGLWAEIIRGAR